MIPNLPLLRVRAGLPADNTTKDVELTKAWDISVSLAERYTDRFLSNAARIEVFTHYQGETIQLKAYPEIVITTITGAIGAHHLNDAMGTLYFDRWLAEHEVSISYTGGYTIFPDDLEYAIMVLFDSVWSIMENPGGGSSTAGALKSVKAGDISIQYDTGGAASVSSEGGLGGSIPPMAMGILQTYRRWTA